MSLKIYKKRAHQPIGVDRAEMDLMDSTTIRDVLMNCCPESIIHRTAVDKAESEADICYHVNAEVTKVIAERAKLLDITLVYISTDYVFNGIKEGEYLATAPLTQSISMELV